MIELATETIMTLEEAAKRVLVNQATVFRWVTQGSKGSKLEAFRVGTRWRTSMEALQRFSDALTPANEPTSAPQSRLQTSRERQRYLERVSELLDEKLGVRKCETCKRL